MDKKRLYAIVAVIVVIVIVVSVVGIGLRPQTKPKASMSVAQSSNYGISGQSLTFYANISGGTPTSVIFNFGDGTTANASHVSGNEYKVAHSFSDPGRYLVTVNATVGGKYLTNYNNIPEVKIFPATASATVASESTEPNIITSTQIYSSNSNVSFTAAILEAPTAKAWTVGFYNWSFATGVSQTDYSIYNTSASAFQAQVFSHTYSTAGIYAVTLSAISFNATGYTQLNYTSGTTKFTYYPVSDYSKALAGQHQSSPFVETLIITAPGQTATIENTTLTTQATNQLTVVEVAPGGPITLDPATQYYTVSGEIVQNVYEFLIVYNGSSTSQFLPAVAKQVPTVSNGLVSSSGLNYTFNIRSGLRFSNGDPLTAWDVYTSVVRELLFTQGTPGTGDWILAQDLLPGGGYSPSFFNATGIYNSINSAVTVNNATESVTFHLLFSDPAFLTYIADELPIEDYNWVSAHGGAITFTPQGFLSYESNGNLINYNSYLQFHEMGSGPYMLESYLVGQQVVLAPNPNFVPISGVAGLDKSVNLTINILYEKDPSTAFLYASNGLANIISGLPSYYNPSMETLQSQGKINIQVFTTTGLHMFAFNFNVNQSMLNQLGSGYTIPQYYFSNPNVRRAYADAFNYTEFINDLLGNSKYGADFGFSYVGVIPKGMPGYITPSNMSNAPSYNLTLAKQYLENSGYYNTSVNIPIIVWAGNTADFAGAGMWAQALNKMDPNIHATPIYELFSTVASYRVPNRNPMPIFMAAYSPDYMYPSDYVNPFLKLGRPNAVGAEWNSTQMSNLGFVSESQNFSKMQSLIVSAETTSNLTLAINEFDQAEHIAVNLTLYTYTYQINVVTYFSPTIHGVNLENSPLLGGAFELKFYFLTT